MGVAGDLRLMPGWTIIGGSVAGIVSCLGYKFLSPVLGKIGIGDICGVHNLHGMPGVRAAVIGIIAAARIDGMKPDMQTAGMFMTLRLTCPKSFRPVCCTRSGFTNKAVHLAIRPQGISHGHFTLNLHTLRVVCVRTHWCRTSSSSFVAGVRQIL